MLITAVCTGVLYYGDQAADGVKASTFVKELTTRAEYDSFVSSQPANVLTVGFVMQHSSHLEIGRLPNLAPPRHWADRQKSVRCDCRWWMSAFAARHRACAFSQPSWVRIVALLLRFLCYLYPCLQSSDCDLFDGAALAKNMQGYASFARLVGDASAEMQRVLQELKVLEVSWRKLCTRSMKSLNSPTSIGYYLVLWSGVQHPHCDDLHATCGSVPPSMFLLPMRRFPHSFFIVAARRSADLQAAAEVRRVLHMPSASHCRFCSPKQCITRCYHAVEHILQLAIPRWSQWS
jgi:hypothetical protein